MAKKHIKSEARSSQAKIETRYYTVGYVPNGGRPNTRPALNLKGRWLHECGFVTGQPVTVTVKNGQLIIDAEILV
ncbi:SymE family type I addiction module toxin [Sodalis sp. dw_96]|uniref:SymE family type I addiction module toxin n=1 Tax=Sodalis sp. dw_96 TaxID=2719794 RepID=UPI001BD554B9|nr:SymE family type I addiction module toxin [Sodalis sp. dw_96]